MATSGGRRRKKSHGSPENFRRCVMNLERTGVSRSELGSLKNCLVEGDPDQERRSTRGKRRAVLASIVVQLLVLAALVVFPLFSKGEHITFERTPVPPYPRLGSHERGPSDPPRRHFECTVCFSNNPPHRHENTDAHPQSIDDDPPFPTAGDPNGVPQGVDFSTPNHEPKAPGGEDSTTPHERRRISIGHIEPALLIQRVEPIYPRIAITLRHETRVELHAIISTDGSVESLEVLSGDPLFYNSALDAVRQWRYHPTKLNGQPVEVDTHITVIYILNH
jgi:TonB family protein